jgi:N-acetylglutamate synthase-like GNAT family acetyltransferase
MKVEKATINDVKQMHVLVNKFAGKGEMLPRALSYTRTSAIISSSAVKMARS